MSRDEQQLRCDIVEVGRRLYARGLIGGHEGNVSVRLDSSLLITPAGVCKGFLSADMIVRTDLDHKRAEKLAKRNPKKERVRPVPAAFTEQPAPEPVAVPPATE